MNDGQFVAFLMGGACMVIVEMLALGGILMYRGKRDHVTLLAMSLLGIALFLGVVIILL